MATLSANPLVPLLWVAILHLAAYAVGRPLARWTQGVRGEAGPAPQAVLHALLLGFVVLGWIGFALAAVHLLVPAWIRLLVGALALLAAVRLTRERLSSRRFLPHWHPTWNDVPALLAALFLLQFLPEALSPLLQQDDLVYHLFLPKTYLETHRLVNLPWHVNANMPHMVEILYTWPMAIGDFTAPKVLTFTFTILTLAGLWGFAVPRCGRFGGGLLLLVYLSGKNVQWHLGIGHVEPVMGAYLMAAVLALEDWRRHGGRGHLLRIGMYCGFAAASKYTGWLFVVAILLGLLAALSKGRGSHRARLGRAALVLGMTVLFVLPWLVKNAAFTGNPVYPNLYTLLDGKGWSQVQENHYRLAMRTVEGAGPVWTWKDYLGMPLRLTLADRYYSCPSFSILLMLLFWIGLIRPGTGGRWIPGIAFLGCVAWALSAPQGRYLVAWVPVMCLAVTGALGFLNRSARRWSFAALGVVLAVSASQLLGPKDRLEPRWRALATRRETVRQNGGYELCEYLNQIVPPGGRVLGMWENRFFFLQRDFEADAVWQVPGVLARLRQLDDPARFAAALHHEGITHVVLRRAGFASYFANHYAYDLTDSKRYPLVQYERDRALVMRFIDEYLTRVNTRGTYSIYLLKPPPSNS